MSLTLTVRSGDAAPEPITFDAPKVVIGRGDNCDLQLPDPSVSHRHASVRQKGATYVVVDEGSTNGTFVGGAQLAKNVPRELQDGDELRVGRIWLDVGLKHAVPTPNPLMATRQLALQLVQGAMEADGEVDAQPFVKVTKGPDAGMTMALTRFARAYTVGRTKACDMCLTDADVSRRHLGILRRGVNVYVTELGSKNGATIQKRTLVPQEETIWKPNTSIKLGQSELELADPLGRSLSELQGAADEVIRDSIAPPNHSGEPLPRRPKRRGELDSDGAAVAQPVADGPKGAVTEVPRKDDNAISPEKRKSSWSAVDILVALLALMVLGVSAAGLYWLIWAS